MNSLKQRLGAIRGRAGTPQAAADVAALTRRIQRLRTGRGQPAESKPVRDDGELAHRLGAERVEEGLLVLERTLPPGARHGLMPIRPSQDPMHTNVQHWLFLDTETTGLAGGSGTLAFLVGVARFRAGCLQLRQYLITRFDAEAAMLRRLSGDLKGCETLISYNGKSFDLPLLATRYRLHGLTDPLANRPHMDLLHGVRRRYSGQWADCRLATVERELLGFVRRDDLPGSQAPGSWLNYLQHGVWDRLAGVLRHNRLDVISLAVLPEALERGPPAMLEPLPGIAAPERSSDRFRALRHVLAAASDMPPPTNR